MATQPNFLRRSEAVTGVERPREAQVTKNRPGAAVAVDPYVLRALPNDDVYFFAKRVDNSRIVREADPRARGTCWSAIGAGCAIVVLLTGMLAPSVGGILAGYQLQALKQEQQRLLDERKNLEVEEAALVSPERMERLAEAQKLGKPGPGQLIHLNPNGDGSLALNLKK